MSLRVVGCLYWVMLWDRCDARSHYKYMPSGWRLKVLRGPYRSAVPLALSTGQTPPSLSIVGLSVDIAHYVRLIGYACK